MSRIKFIIFGGNINKIQKENYNEDPYNEILKFNNTIKSSLLLKKEKIDTA